MAALFIKVRYGSTGR